MAKDTTKPVWPHEGICHLVPHMGAGQWSKTYRQRTVYFGRLADPDAALRKYLAWAKGIAAKDPVAAKPIPADALTLHVALNHWLTARSEDVAKGNLSAGQYLRYRRAARLVFKVLGRERAVLDLRPEHFAALKASIKGGPRNVANVIRDIRIGFNWVDEHYRVRPVMGTSFDRPPARAIRAASGKRDLWTPQDLRAVLAVAEPPARAMILLGINCGFGQADCAGLRHDQFDLEAHAMPRGKTGVERRCPLWPETIAAIADARYHRWRLASLHPELVFVSKYGKPLVGDVANLDAAGRVSGLRRRDAVREKLRRACRKAGVAYRPFYSLRHTFRSVADPVGDVTAIHCIMGHALPGIGGVYTQLMADGMARLRAVTDRVHAWLYDGVTR